MDKKLKILLLESFAPSTPPSGDGEKVSGLHTWPARSFQHVTHTPALSGISEVLRAPPPSAADSRPSWGHVGMRVATLTAMALVRALTNVQGSPVAGCPSGSVRAFSARRFGDALGLLSK